MLATHLYLLARTKLSEQLKEVIVTVCELLKVQYATLYDCYQKGKD